MDKSKHPVTSWLDQNIYNKSEPNIYMLKHRNLDTYYLRNDKNLDSNNEFKINEMKDLIKKNKSLYYQQTLQEKTYQDLEYDKDLIRDSNYVHVFKKDDTTFVQYIDQDTRRYHVNMLFNKLIDYCYNKKIIGFKGELLINKKMRNEFVKFCYNNSK